MHTNPREFIEGIAPMNCMCRTAWLAPVLVAVGTLLPCGGNRCAHAQIFAGQPDSQFELAATVQIDEADSTVSAQLQRAKAYLADRQWDEAVETLREVMENVEDKLLGVTEHRYISLRDYCHLQFAALPPDALKLYRSRVDPVARKWYEEGIAGRDRRLLAKVVEHAPASSWGDDALLALGETALESGDYVSARWFWERIIPSEPPSGVARTWPGFPDTELDLAAVRARLVLVSILEGSRDRAHDELTQFTRLHGEAQGRFGGREVNYAKALAALLAESAAWPREKPDPDWSTFAGNTLRNKIAPELIDVGEVAWRTALGTADAGADRPPGVHPLLIGDLVLVNNRSEIRAMRAATGKPAWGQAGSVVYRAQFEPMAEPSEPLTALGTARFTMTAFGGKLYARMGSTVTSRPHGADLPDLSSSRFGGYLVCLDLAAEGRLMWKISAEQGWALEGSPVADGSQVYVGMRRDEVRPQAHVACFDARTGRRLWRRFVCAAETPARGMLPQSTHNLLTLAGEVLYYNTNLGAVSAISARDGRLMWVSLYPRALRGDLLELAPHWQRDLNPCLYDRGTLLVAPSDSPRIFAFDAATGQILWQTGTQLENVVHLLGTTADYLIAGGQKLYWIGLKGEDTGRVKHVWPDGPEKPGFGRGILAGDCVLWPTREKVYIFDQKTAQPRKVIDLVPRGATGGNLLVAGGRLLIATGTELIALSPYGGMPKETGACLARIIHRVAHPERSDGCVPRIPRPSLRSGTCHPLHSANEGAVAKSLANKQLLKVR